MTPLPPPPPPRSNPADGRNRSGVVTDVERLRAALIHVMTRRHKFRAACDKCWAARELVREALLDVEKLGYPVPGHPSSDRQVEPQGVADVGAGRTKPWAEVRARLLDDKP